MPPKRPAPSPSTQSQPSRSTGQSSSTRARPTKRTKLARPNAAAAPAPPLPRSEVVPATPDSSPSPSPSPPPFIPFAPPSRVKTEGSLRRLTSGHPASAKGVRPTATLSGAKVGGKSKDLRDGADKEELWVTRKGLGFAGFLKKGVAAFTDRGCISLTLYAMGAAIPLCLSLSLAIRDALPGGGDSEGGVVDMDVRTGTSAVQDEVTPDDEDEDIVYQTRHKSIVTIVLSIDKSVAAGLSVQSRGARASDRGGRRRGGGAPRGRGRGRGK